ncbi:ion channel TACAN isoform X1 [Oryzias melastigma]|uniref:ion channel TACAN isoform X1 n=1 Tax=Oryzias melastigma TaxID=30732 RepID=UPI00168D4096|nr:ion channel TACAN isoform X1 [Oryzias melastigma]
MSQDLADVVNEWTGLEEEYQHLQDTHKRYLQKLDEISKLQNNCSSSIARQRKKLKELSRQIKKKKLSQEDANTLAEIKDKLKTRQNVFTEMEAFLPKKNGLYLSLVLGNVNVTLLSKQSKFAYKDEYEKFKLYLTVILLLLSFICYGFVSYRFLDAILNFLLVWFYCTLTIRESILITNGSRIKGWWVFHHYISAFLSGVMLTWPDGNLYKMFRGQFLAYCLYQMSAVLLSEWMSVQTTNPWRKTQHGSDRRGFPVLDVEGTDVSFALPVFRSFLAAFQWPVSVQDGSTPRLQRMAGPGLWALLPYSLHGEFLHHSCCRSSKIQEEKSEIKESVMKNDHLCSCSNSFQRK